jgi:hypothetical protein
MMANDNSVAMIASANNNNMVDIITATISVTGGAGPESQSYRMAWSVISTALSAIQFTYAITILLWLRSSYRLALAKSTPQVCMHASMHPSIMHYHFHYHRSLAIMSVVLIM